MKNDKVYKLTWDTSCHDMEGEWHKMESHKIVRSKEKAKIMLKELQNAVKLLNLGKSIFIKEINSENYKKYEEF